MSTTTSNKDHRIDILDDLHRVFEKAFKDDEDGAYSRHPDGERLLLKVGDTLYAIDATPWSWPKAPTDEQPQ